MIGERGTTSPVPSEWFSANLRYEGMGCAEFTNPEGQIRGPAVATFDDSGRSVVYLDGDLIAEGDVARGWRVLGLLSPGQPSENGRHQVINGSTWCSNPCAKLTIETPEGVFVASKDVHYGISIPGENGHEVRLTFRPLLSEFGSANPGAARYWVLPLFNFVSDFVQRADMLDAHPLRIYRATPKMAELSEEENRLRLLIAMQGNRLIVFQLQGDLGFVERLPDYDTRVAAPKNRHLARTVTAVMVGAVGDNPIDLPEVEGSWLPCHFLDLLSLATGSRVGSPWIEFRDAEGRLVRRVHIELGLPQFSQGRPAMDERQWPGTGQLLTTARFPEYFTATDLRVVVRHLIDAWENGINGIHVEEALGHVCRAIERVATATGVVSRDVLDDMSDERRKKVKDALVGASREIGRIAEEALAAGSAKESDSLTLISQWMGSNRAYKDASFGRSVLRLLERFELPDAQVMARASQGNANRWARELSECRNIPLHAGHFDVRSGRHDSDRLVATWWHLTDIAMRVLLKILGYTGRYQPAVGVAPQLVQPLDWAKPELDQRNLGYG